MRSGTSLILAALALCTACGGDHASAPPSTLPPPTASAHESTDPRPGVPGVIEKDAGSDAAAEAQAPIVLVADAGAEGTVTNGNDIVAAQRAKLRACYARGTAGDRRNKGHLVIHLDIDGSGGITPSAGQNEGYSPGLVTCLGDILKAGKYSVSPAGAHASLNIPTSSRDIAK